MGVGNIQAFQASVVIIEHYDHFSKFVYGDSLWLMKEIEGQSRVEEWLEPSRGFKPKQLAAK